ncbi:MAG: SpoIIE family protein phosphatase [Marmoricola sp.]
MDASSESEASSASEDLAAFISPFVRREGPLPREIFTRHLAGQTASSTALSQMAGLAARLLGAGSAQVSLISDVQTVVGGHGAAERAVGKDSPTSESLCTVTVAGGAPLVVHDAPNDARVAHLPPVASGMVGAYLGVPLVVRGHLVGALSVFGDEPRQWGPQDVMLLEQLAVPVVAELQFAALTSDYENERLLWQLAVDAADVGAFDWNLETGELRWDDKLLSLFGLTRDTFGGTIEAFNDVVHPDDRDRVTAALAAAVDTCGSYDAEYRIILPDRTIRWVTARGRALPGSDGAATRVLGAAFDTTAVQDGEARVARVLETMPTAFFHLDREWRFTYLNVEGLRLLGGIGTPIVGSVIWEAFPESVGSDFETYYRRAIETGEPVEFEAYYPPPLDRWYEIRGWPSPDGLSVYFFDITKRRLAEEAALTALERTKTLSSITDALTSTLHVEEAAEQVARLVVGPLACWSIVTLIDLDGATNGPQTPARTWRRGLRDVAAWHADPEMRELLERYRTIRMDALTGDSFLAHALEHSRPVVVAEGATEAIASVLEPGEARDLARRLAPTAVVVAPLRGRGRTVGLLSAFRSPEQGPFSPEDIADLADAAARAGLALDNARLYSEQADLAAELQHSLMTAPPEPDHLHVVVRYLPAAATAQIGGDWYDSFLQPHGATNVVIGDVVGHNTAATAAMGQVRGLLRGIAVTTGEGPAEVLARVDEAMETLQIDTTATCVIARFEQTPEEREQDITHLRWSNAGHPPPLLVYPPAEDGSVEVTALWPQQPELLLGLDPDVARTDAVLSIPRGSTVLLYTDGLVERRGQLLDEGIDRLSDTVAGLVSAGVPLDDLCDQVLARMVPSSPEDDVAIVAVHLYPEAGPRPPEAGPENIPDNVPPLEES